MGSSRNKVHLQISGALCLMGALALLVLPLKWVFAAVTAALFHELCHVVAVWLCSGRVQGMSIGSSGAVINVSPMSRGRELLCALAGPMGGLILLLFVKWIPMVALCAAFQSTYNLLPIYPLDGGRAMRCGAAILLPPPAADRVCFWTGKVVQMLLLCAGVYGCFGMKLGLMPVVLALLLALKAKPVNNSCKQCDQRVQ